MLKFETLKERRANQKINIVLFAPSGAGKTTQARFLDPETTLFIDGEAGTLALTGPARLENGQTLPPWEGTVFDIRKHATQTGIHPWELSRAIACLLAGPDPSASSGPYSKAMYEQYVAALGGPEQFDRFKTIYVDSATVFSRWSFDWAQKQPEAFSEKTGKPDTRGAYGLHGREMVAWATQLQHQSKNIILSCILDEKTDDFGRKIWEPQIVGGMAGRELPGIFDIVLTLNTFKTGDGKSYRAFATQKDNPYGYPAKDRSSLLSPLEEPNLGKLIAKIQGVTAPQPTTQPTQAVQGENTNA